MGLLFIIVVGLVVGWLAAVIRRAESARSVLIQMGAGVVGALVGGTLLAPVLGTDDLFGGTYHVPALLLTLVGAAAVVALLSMLRLVPSR